MASTSSSGRGYCKHDEAGKVCRCQEWELSSENELSCDCCGCHISFNEPCHPINSGFGRCLKEFREEGILYEDGCQEFRPSVADPRRCWGCGCHRNIHKNVVGVGNLASSLNVCSQQTPHMDCSVALVEPSSKRLKLESATISLKVGDCGKAFETNNSVKLKSGVPTVDNCNIANSNLLEPKHKVFLSHSGAQKCFVEQLCLDLERLDRYPFFDKRRNSLPIGEEFPKLIFDAIQQSQIGVVIVSEEFFTRTKWPMLELVAMVKEKNTKPESGFKIIPVFYHISRDQCHDPHTHLRWISQWKEWAKFDKRINIEEWKIALTVFGPVSGLIKEGMGEVECRKEIVEAVCKSVLPEIRWDDSHVQGRLRLCEVIRKKIIEVRDGLIDGVRVVGLYGMGGIGKTTACKSLCNELWEEFYGRVCYVELGSMNKVELFREMLRRLTDIRHNILGQLNDEGQCRDLLKRCIYKERRVFLVIDNMSDNLEFIRQASTYLGAGFAKGSIVLVTARSMDELMCLSAYMRESDCIRMAELEEVEARTLFLNHAFSARHVRKELNNGGLILQGLISRCIQRCYYLKGDGTLHYHPLALQVLGELLGCVSYDSGLWEVHLQRIDMFDDELSRNEHPIFSILRTSYDVLLPEVQMMFMDIALFVPSSGWHNDWNSCDWLSMVHGLRVDEVIRRLEYLKKKSLLDISKLEDGLFGIGMHDLWREFAVAETKAGKFRKRRCLHLEKACPNLGESSPSGRCWENLKRMCFMNDGLMILHELNLDYFCNVTVLKLVGESSLSNIAMDLGALKHLKSLEVENSGSRKLPDISKLTSLRVACFKGNDKVDTITGLSSKLTNLRILDLEGCRSLRSCPGVNELVALEELNLLGCTRLEKLPNLGKLVNLRRLNIFGCDSMIRELENISELVALEGLRSRFGKNRAGTSNSRHPGGRRGPLKRRLFFLDRRAQVVQDGLPGDF